MKLRPEDFEMSPLAAYGLVAIALIFGVLGLEKFSATENRLAQKVITAQTELATLSAIGETDHWDTRLLESTKAREHIQSEIWQGNTGGVIAAEVQQALRGIAAKNKFTSVQIRVDPDPIEIDGVTVINFEFRGQAPTSKALANYFEDLALGAKLMIVDEMSFAQSIRERRPPRVNFAGIAPVQIAPNGGA